MARRSRPADGTAAWFRLRRFVFDRDRHRCQSCGGAGWLECHHRVPVSEGGAELDPANLTTICRSCHIRLHRKETPERAEWRRYLRDWNERPRD